MPTPAIFNTSSVVPGQKPGAKQSSSAAPDGAFNQMLSQQLADRRSASNAEQARAANKPNEASKVKDKQPADKGQSAEAKKMAEGSATSEAAKASRDREELATAGDAGAIPPTATELLAMTANSLLKPQAPATDPAIDPATTEASAAIGKDRLLGTISEDPLTQAETGADSADFDATLDQAGQRRQAVEQSRQGLTGVPNAISTADGKAQEKLTELSLAAKLQDGPQMTGAVPQLQQTGLDMTQAATGRVTDRLSPQVGTPAWDQALGQKVVWMVAGSHQSASLTLNPPDLGPMQVVLTVTNGQADAAFYAAQPEVRQALEGALSKLRDMMSESGVQLGQTTVSAGMPDQHNQPGQPGQHAARQAARGLGQDQSHTDAAAPLARTQILSGGQGLVDTFA